MVWEVFLLNNIENHWLVFIPLLRRVSQDTSCVLVHGYSAFDLHLMPLVMVQVNVKRKIEIQCMK
jgi:hypothetical protein